MKKNNAAKAAKMYWSIVKKHRRKFAELSPTERAARSAEADAKINRMIADLKAKADEAPVLRAEKESLEQKLRTEKHRLAALAAQFHVAYDVSMDEAVKLAIEQIQAVNKLLSVPATTASAKGKVASAQSALDTGMGFDEFVLYVTGLKKRTQALGRFKGFLLAKFKPKPGSQIPDARMDATLATYRARGDKRLLLRQADAEPLKRRIADWWKQEKKALAQKAGKAGAKQRKLAKKIANSRRICPECGKRELEPRKRLCGCCRIRAKVTAAGHSEDGEIAVLSDLVQAMSPSGAIVKLESGRTPLRGGE